MSTFVLIHGGGDVGASWRLVERALRKLGHHTLAPDLPCDDNNATLDDYADAVIRAIGRRRKHLIVVGHSYGGFTAPIVAERCRPAVDLMVLIAAMVPRPGESPARYWKDTRHAQAVKAQAIRDHGLTGHADPMVQYYHDVPRKLANRAMRSARDESMRAYETGWPLKRWPKVPTKFVLCTNDRLFPPDYMRRVVRNRLGVVADEFPSGHYPLLAKPNELAALLDAYASKKSKTT